MHFVLIAPVPGHCYMYLFTFNLLFQYIAGEDGNSNMTYIIAGVCAGVALIVIVIVIIVCLLMKSKTRPVTPFDSKSVFWRTQAKTRPVTAVQPSVPPKFPEPPGHVETNVFDVELPDGRGNLLPPLSSEFGTKTVES